MLKKFLKNYFSRKHKIKQTEQFHFIKFVNFYVKTIFHEYYNYNEAIYFTVLTKLMFTINLHKLNV